MNTLRSKITEFSQKITCRRRLDSKLVQKSRKSKILYFRKLLVNPVRSLNSKTDWADGFFRQKVKQRAFFLKLGRHQAGFVRNPANANPGLKIHRANKRFSCKKMFFTAYVLCYLRLL